METLREHGGLSHLRLHPHVCSRKRTVGVARGISSLSGNTFNQNNSPNTTELIDLINQLRQMSTQIPADQQEEVTVNLEDLETEAAKPEAQRSQPRLKRSLEFLATTGKSIAGFTEFTNTAIDLAHKFGIHLPFNI